MEEKRAGASTVSSVGGAIDGRKSSIHAVSIVEETTTIAAATTTGPHKTDSVVVNSHGRPISKNELLGPSLLEVLTLKNPPRPYKNESDKEQQEQNERDENNDTNSNNNNKEEESKLEVGLSRSTIIGKLVDSTIDNTKKVQEYFAKMLESLRCDATGLVLLQEHTIVIFIESSSDQFLEICKELLKKQNIINPMSLKVLGSCDDNANRILQGLYFKKVSITKTSENSERTDETVRQHVVEAFLNLVKFIKKIGPMQAVRKRIISIHPFYVLYSFFVLEFID
jgi:hypothetical protein